MNKDKYIKKLNSLKKIIGESSPKTYILTGSMVIHLYKLKLSNIMNCDYRNPNDIDLLCSEEFFKSIVPKDYKQNKYNIQYPKIGSVDFYLCDKKSYLKNSINFDDICYVMNINDILKIKKYELANTTLDLLKTFYDLDFISKIILLNYKLSANISKESDELIIQQLQTK